jgi:type VI secretion system protein ImpL
MYLVTVLILLIYLVLVWFLAGWLRLQGSDVWILRGALALLGLVGAVVALWYQHKIKKAKEASGEDESQPSGMDDLDALVREGIRQLKRSSLGRGADLASQPVVFVLGDSGSTKTTALIHSALDPELLAGQVYRDEQVVPTALANLWYTRQAVFVDPAGELMSQRERWKRFVKLLQPARFSAAFGKKKQAPRAAIVCFDCEIFLQPGASETSLSAARRLSARLHEISQLLGISFPVYVLFTKLDRVSFFAEFVRGMSKDDVGEVLGATLPLRSPGGGVYADEESRRLTKAFDEIFYSLAERRIVLLPREHDGEKLPGIYEFPRELNKLRKLLVPFLVDLARPSQLGANPFLRGFYFTGVRPIVVEDVVAAPAFMEAQQEDAPLDAGATQIFRGLGSQRAQAHAPSRSAGPRRMPQWVFLSSLFNDVLVKDRVALAASGSSSRVHLLRRIALGAAVLAAVVCLTGFAISFFRNHALEDRVHGAEAALQNVRTSSGQAASLEDLQKLEDLRAELADLSDWKTNGAPWSFRWGLYEGDEIYKQANPVYFQHFRRILFDQTQDRIVQHLNQLSAKGAANAPDEDYEKSYNELREYLIAGKPEDHGYSDKSFMTPVLMSHWNDKGAVADESQKLAALQFDYYSTELAKRDEFDRTHDNIHAFDITVESNIVGRAQGYLLQFAGIGRYYVRLIAEASKGNPDLIFYDQYSNAKAIIRTDHPKVKGAFTRGGYTAALNALNDPQLYKSCEKWVLGDCGQAMDQKQAQPELTNLYNQTFVKEWNAVLRTSSVAPYTSYHDAAQKLKSLADPGSPVLELLHFISHNVDSATEVKDPFVPVQKVEDPGPADKLPPNFVGPVTEKYVEGLGKLAAAMDDLSRSSGTPDPDSVKSADKVAEDAKGEVTPIMIKAGVDSSPAHNQEQVRRLLEEPINFAENLLGRAPADTANGSGKSFCSQFGKYPLNANSQQEMSIDDLNSLFGDSFKKLTEDAKSFVTKGSVYAASSPKTSAEFVAFLNHMSRLKDALYPNGATSPKFTFGLKRLPSNGETQVKVGNEKLSGTDTQKQFVWTGAEEVEVLTKNGDSLSTFQPPWSMFRFIGRAHKRDGNKLEWLKQTDNAPDTLPGGKPWSYDYELQVAGANPFFELPGLKCVSKVAGP